jgi:hypothetical protein
LGKGSITLQIASGSVAQASMIRVKVELISVSRVCPYP